METASIYKIIAVFEIIIASLLGAALPFVYMKHVEGQQRKHEHEHDVKEPLNNQPIFFVLKSMTCGVIIGVALLHLAPDADENLGEEYGYPVTFVLMGVGILVNLVCEQVALYIISTTRVTIENNFCPKHSAVSMTQQLVKDSNASDEPNTTSEVSSRFDSTASARSHSQSSRQLSVNSRMDCCEVGAVVAVFANANDPRALLKAYVLEGAIAVHSIIMGVSLGSMQKDELANIKILMIAYAVHQFLEGISLGCAMSSTDLTPNKVAGLVMFFACTLPMGIVIGIIITYVIEDSHGQEMVEGYANALAAGILVYVSMVEMLAEEFNHPLVKEDYLLKSKMILALGFGFLSMSLLAIWA